MTWLDRRAPHSVTLPPTHTQGERTKRIEVCSVHDSATACKSLLALHV